MRIRFWLAILCVGSLAQAQNNAPVPAAGNVALPLDEYNQLVTRAEQAPKPNPEPPVPQLLNSAQMNLRVEAESVTGTTLIQGEVLAQGERKVPLISGVVIRGAQLQGTAGQPAQDVPVEQEGGTLAALLTGPAPFAVALDTAVPLVIEPGRASFKLPAPQAGAVRATLSIPGDQTQVNLSPGLITSRRSQGGRTIIEAALVPGSTATVWWAARLSVPEAPAPPKETRFSTDVKTLISVGDGELSIAALAQVTVVQGEPAEFTVQIPEGYELTGATGATLASNEIQKDSVRLTVTNAALRSHQFLITLARSSTAPSAKIPLMTFEGTQRETGEVLVEGEGAMELTATETGVLRRMDLKETDPYLRSMARSTLHTAFRYQKKPGETPAVALNWVRFPNSRMLAAVAQQAEATTLVTSEGRTLTEIKLTIRNQSQPFLKVDLPQGATILSAEVAGEKVKPVQGSDGSRVPLLRPGFRPTDAYEVSFVFLHPGAPFARKGETGLELPKMDVPIARVEWEVYLPERYKLTDFSGDALPARLLPLAQNDDARAEQPVQYPLLSAGSTLPVGPGDVGGVVLDAAGAVVAGASVTVKQIQSGATFSAVTDARGRWRIGRVPPGRLEVSATAPGFNISRRLVSHAVGRATEFSIDLQVGSTAESVTVTAEVGGVLLKTEGADASRQVTLDQLAQVPPSANVTDLQRRVTGVLPIAINVPRAGNSYRFARALAVDQETRLTFRYRAR